MFQDPLRSQDPELTVRRIVAEPLAAAGTPDRRARAERVDEALALAGLDPVLLGDRTPAQISGGQRQRASLARAVVTRPALLITDEPVSALDASNRNLVLRLLDRLRAELGLTVVVISHDLSSLAGIADRVAVLYRGRLVEQGAVGQVLERPAHPYTALLTASAPRVRDSGEPEGPRPADLRPPRDREPWPDDQGCVFASRCRFADAACHTEPVLLAAPGADPRADPWADPGGGRGGGPGPGSRAGSGSGRGQAAPRDVACHHAGEWRQTLARDLAPGTDVAPGPDAGTPRHRHRGRTRHRYPRPAGDPMTSTTGHARPVPHSPATDAGSALPPLDLGSLPAVRVALAERAAEHDRDAGFPTEGFALVHEAGLLTATVGPGTAARAAGSRTPSRILRALGAGDPSVALVTAMTLFAHAAQPRRAGPPTSTRRCSPSRPGARPDQRPAGRAGPRHPRARRPAGHHGPADRRRLGAHRPQDLLHRRGRVALDAGLGPDRRGSGTRRRVPGPRRLAPASPSSATWDHLGLRASRSDDVLFDRVPVPATGRRSAWPSPGRPARTRAACAPGTPWASPRSTSGVAAAARDWLIGFLRERVPTNLGAAAGHRCPASRARSAQIAARLLSATTLVDTLALAVDRGRCRWTATRTRDRQDRRHPAAIDAVQRAVALIGNAGLTRATRWSATCATCSARASTPRRTTWS